MNNMNSSIGIPETSGLKSNPEHSGSAGATTTKSGTATNSVASLVFAADTVSGGRKVHPIRNPTSTEINTIKLVFELRNCGIFNPLRSFEVVNFAN